MTAANVIRVLNGRLSGTEKPVPPAGTVSVGHEFWQDVVIRDPATKGQAVDLTFADGAAQLMVLSGEAKLLGSRIEAAQSVLLPPYVPFSIGGVALAWGDPASERWTEAGGLAASEPAPLQLPPGARDQAVAAFGTALQSARTRAEAVKVPRRLLGVMAVLIAFVLVVALGPSAVASLGLLGDPVHRTGRALAEAGFPDLRVRDDPAGEGVIVSGLVTSQEARAKAQQAVAGTSIPAQLQLQTGAELASAVGDVARIRGIPAVAKPLALGTVELRTVPISDDQRDNLVTAIRSDVHGVRRLKLRGDLPPAEEAPLRSVADTTKKVSTVVSGDPSYIQTVDGARYFSGAMLPSGHRLVAIRGNVVVVEKGGRETQIAF